MRKCLIVLFCLLCEAGFAQDRVQSSSKSAMRAYSLAKEYLATNEYAKAVAELRKAIADDDGFTAAHQQLGDIYRRISDYSNAKVSYRKVLEIDPDFYPLTWFGLAESELKTGDYVNALMHFRKYAATPGLSAESKTKTEKYINDCLFSMGAIKNPVSFKLTNLGTGINSEQDEYLPVLTADEKMIIFTRRTGNNEDFYTSVGTGGQWSPALGLAGINTLQFNEGSQCISPDGKYLFFTGCNRPGGLGRCDIYVSKREGGQWSEPFNLGGPVNTSGWESQPSISADGRSLYFVSTRSGGQGGNDIWMVELGNEGWSTPVNLGPKINTPFDEHSPYIHPDNQTLYFSSDGWPGLGRKDLFVSRREHPGTGQWSKAQNLGYPINTFAEESGLSVSADGKLAFYASDQGKGMGGFDIYSFDLPDPLKPLPVTYVEGKVFDSSSRKTLDAAISIINLKDGNRTFDDVTEAGDGTFLATMIPGNSFALNVSREGYLFYSQNFTPSLEDALSPYTIEVALQKIEPGRMVTLNNIFFETDKFDLLPESETELRQLIYFLDQNPAVTIEIEGHTDSTGDEKSNMLLSQNRARTVYKYLIDNKIEASRLSFKGHGEQQPVADNSTDDGKRLNRRTTFRIIKGGPE